MPRLTPRPLDSTSGGGDYLAVDDRESNTPEDRPRSLSRGGLLKAGAVAAAAVGTTPVASVAAGPRAVDPLRHLRLATYGPLVNSLFKIQHPHQPLRAKLVEVVEYRPRGRFEEARREAFSLLFDVQRAELLVQGTYALEHHRLGTFSLFLVPVGRGEKGLFLEAIVNRWLDATHP